MTHTTCDGCGNPIDKDARMKNGAFYNFPWDVCNTCRQHLKDAFTTHTLRAHTLKENNNAEVPRGQAEEGVRPQ